MRFSYISTKVKMLVIISSSRGGVNVFTYSGDLRIDNDIKQIVIARLLNVSQATYSRYETGDLEIPISAFIKLAEFYNTSIDYLVGITDEKTAYKRVKTMVGTGSGHTRHHKSILQP